MLHKAVGSGVPSTFYRSLPEPFDWCGGVALHPRCTVRASITITNTEGPIFLNITRSMNQIPQRYRKSTQTMVFI